MLTGDHLGDAGARQLDLMTDKGQTILVFLTITGLGMPFLTAVIAPVALFAACFTASTSSTATVNSWS